MTERDFATEMRSFLESATSTEYVAAVVAQRVVDRLRKSDPELLTGWLQLRATETVRLAINERARHQRTAARRTVQRGAFADAASQDDGGLALARFLPLPYKVGDSGLTKRLADLTPSDLKYVADGYHQTSREAALEEAFFRALAKKVTGGTVADHFTEQQITSLRASLNPAA